jgi:hypothetical protein
MPVNGRGAPINTSLDRRCENCNRQYIAHVAIQRWCSVECKTKAATLEKQLAVAAYRQQQEEQRTS